MGTRQERGGQRSGKSIVGCKRECVIKKIKKACNKFEFVSS